jgi:hypothetical protein
MKRLPLVLRILALPETMFLWLVGWAVSYSTEKANSAKRVSIIGGNDEEEQKTQVADA